mmetsp:Transcript_57146/g.121297  ORF Transcript_57146/g.121297 Transcript_57146/m.121297 type:complete len:301 (-) Transcript_57146:109-1011(-)
MVSSSSRYLLRMRSASATVISPFCIRFQRWEVGAPLADPSISSTARHFSICSPIAMGGSSTNPPEGACKTRCSLSSSSTVSSTDRPMEPCSFWCCESIWAMSMHCAPPTVRPADLTPPPLAARVATDLHAATFLGTAQRSRNFLRCLRTKEAQLALFWCVPACSLVRGLSDRWCNNAEKSSDPSAPSPPPCGEGTEGSPYLRSSSPEVHRRNASASQCTRRNMEMSHTGSSLAEWRAVLMAPLRGLGDCTPLCAPPPWEHWPWEPSLRCSPASENDWPAVPADRTDPMLDWLPQLNSGGI